MEGSCNLFYAGELDAELRDLRHEISAKEGVAKSSYCEMMQLRCTCSCCFVRTMTWPATLEPARAQLSENASRTWGTGAAAAAAAKEEGEADNACCIRSMQAASCGCASCR